MIFFTADTHFLHGRIIEYCARPFTMQRFLGDQAPDVERMNNVLIANWNNVVTETDCVYMLGDFSFGGVEQAREILHRLNGEIILVIGNHDKKIKKQHGLFAEVHKYLELHYDGMKLLLTHYPVIDARDINGRPFNERDYDLCLHGHVHEKYKFSGFNSVNVGTDVWNFTPVTFGHIVAAKQLEDKRGKEER